MALNLTLPYSSAQKPDDYVPGVNPELDAQIAALGAPVAGQGAPVPPMPKLVTPPRVMPGQIVPLPPLVAPAAQEPAPQETAPVASQPTPVQDAPAPSPGLAAPDYAAAIKVGPDTKTSRIKPTQGFQDARKALDANDEARKLTAKEESDLNQRKAADIAEDEDQFAEDRKAFEERESARRAKIEGEHVAAKEAAKELREKHSKDYEKTFFEEKGVARQWLAALSVGLGAYSASMRGGPNHAFSILKDNMDAHASREKGRLQRQKEEIERLGQDATAINQQLRDYDTITRPQQEAALLQSASERRKRLLASYGVEAAAIEGDKLLQSIESEKQTRVANLEANLGTRIESDNSEQQKMRRAQALGVTGDGEKLTERQHVAATGLAGALQDIAKAHKDTKEFTPKDRELVEQYIGEARQIKESDPEKFRAAFNKLGGNYYSQLSPNGKKRFNHIQQAAQDMERVLSGGVINPHEFATRVSLAAEPGGLRHLTDRARAMATGLPPGTRSHWNQQIGATEQLWDSGAQAPQGQPAPRQAAETKAQAVRALRSVKDPQHKAALEWARDNPGDPRAAQILGAVGVP